MDQPYESLTTEQLEQGARQARDAARATKAQFDAYVETGFTGQQALALTVAWLQAQMGGTS